MSMIEQIKAEIEGCDFECADEDNEACERCSLLKECLKWAEECQKELKKKYWAIAKEKGLEKELPSSFWIYNIFHKPVQNPLTKRQFIDDNEQRCEHCHKDFPINAICEDCYHSPRSSSMLRGATEKLKGEKQNNELKRF